VNNDHANVELVEQSDIVAETIKKAIGLQQLATDLDDKGLLSVLPDVGKRVFEYFYVFHETLILVLADKWGLKRKNPTPVTDSGVGWPSKIWLFPLCRGPEFLSAPWRFLRCGIFEPADNGRTTLWSVCGLISV